MPAKAARMHGGDDSNIGAALESSGRSGPPRRGAGFGTSRLNSAGRGGMFFCVGVTYAGRLLYWTALPLVPGVRHLRP